MYIDTLSLEIPVFRLCKFNKAGVSVQSSTLCTLMLTLTLQNKLSQLTGMVVTSHCQLVRAVSFEVFFLFCIRKLIYFN